MNSKISKRIQNCKIIKLLDSSPSVNKLVMIKKIREIRLPASRANLGLRDSKEIVDVLSPFYNDTFRARKLLYPIINNGKACVDCKERIRCLTK